MKTFFIILFFSFSVYSQENARNLSTEGKLISHGIYSWAGHTLYESAMQIKFSNGLLLQGDHILNAKKLNSNPAALTKLMKAKKILAFTGAGIAITASSQLGVIIGNKIAQSEFGEEFATPALGYILTETGVFRVFYETEKSYDYASETLIPKAVDIYTDGLERIGLFDLIYNIDTSITETILAIKKRATE